MSGFRLGVDLGGTKILVLAIGPDGKVAARAKESTPVDQGFDKVCAGLERCARKAAGKADIAWEKVSDIGVAVPTSVDPDTGEALHAPNLGWKNKALKKTLEKIFKRKVHLGNDVNCGTFAEYMLGAGKGARTLVAYFVGTGLGGGIVIDGKMQTGLRGAAAELGHEIIRAKGRKCGCGKKGCVEAYCSKTAFCREFERLINLKGRSSVLADIHGKDFSVIKSGELKKAWMMEDKVTRKVLKKAMRMLGLAIANQMSILGPDRVVLGGGVIEALGDELLPFVRKGIKKNLFAYDFQDVDLRISQLGDDAVPLGAALMGAQLAPLFHEK